MKKIVIVGGGAAGLAAGIFGQIHGFDCTVVEKNAHPGGNLTGWKRNGCEIDNCIHWLNGSNEKTELYKTWRLLGIIDKNTVLWQNPFFFTSSLGDKKISFWQNLEKTKNEMLLLSPEDFYEIDFFISAVKALGLRLTGEKMSGRERTFLCRAILRYSKMTLFELSEKFFHPLLKLAMTDFIGGEFSALALAGAYAAFAFGDGKIPIGGSRKAAERAAKRFTDLGGTLITGNAVEKLCFCRGRGRGAVLKNGDRVFADYIIFACDPTVTFSKFLDKKYMPSGMKRMYSNKTASPVFSSVHTAFACDSAAIPAFGTEIFKTEPFETDGKQKNRLVLKEFSYDSSFAPEGKTVLQTLDFLHESECRNWISSAENRAEYNAKKEEYAEKIKKRIIRQFPAAAQSLELLDVWTPATYKEFLGANTGAYLSFAMTPSAVLYRQSPAVPGFKNIFLATQWQCSPGGLPQAVSAGKRAIEKIISREKSLFG